MNRFLVGQAATASMLFVAYKISSCHGVIVAFVGLAYAPSPRPSRRPTTDSEVWQCVVVYKRKVPRSIAGGCVKSSI